MQPGSGGGQRMDTVGAVPEMWVIESQSGLGWEGPLKARVKRRSLGTRVFLIKGRKQGVCGRKGASFSWMKGKDLHACLQTPQHFPKCWFYASLSFDFFLSEELISLVVLAWEPVTMQQRCPSLPPLPCPTPFPTLWSQIPDKATQEQSCPANSGNYQEAWSRAEIMGLK